MRLAVGCAWLALAAAAPAHADAEHDRIRRERDEAGQRYAGQQRACLTRFVSAPCLDAARAEQRDTLQRLRQQQLELDERARREATEARRHAVEATRERSLARLPSADRASSAPEPASTARRPTDAPGRLFPERSGLPRLESPQSAATEAAKSARFEARAREAEAHREKVLQRNAERAARGKLAAPLPAPDAASAPVR